jgi:flagellar motor protein MotB
MRTHARRHHHAAEEESYFISMTDIMVGLLFIFIIMLMTFALQYRKAEIRKHEETVKIQSAEELAKEAKEEILRAVADHLSRHGVTVYLDERQGVLRLPEEMLFDKARADLNPRGREALDRVAEALSIVLPCYVPQRPTSCPAMQKALLDAVFIEGHTDADPMRLGARFRDNLELSTARAANTWRAIMRLGPPPAAGESVENEVAMEPTEPAAVLGGLRNRNGRPILSVSGYGDQRPVAGNDTEEGKRANRRIDLRFLMSPLRPEELEEIARRVDAGKGGAP